MRNGIFKWNGQEFWKICEFKMKIEVDEEKRDSIGNRQNGKEM